MYRLCLKELRKKAGFRTQRDIAKRLGIKERKYASWEREEVAIGLEDAYTLAVTLDCTPNDLCGWPQAPAVPDMPPDEQKLVGCYRDLDRERKDRLLKTAQDALVAKKDEPSSLALPQPRSA
jgi:transcriptional regulator with XRE-family HTH domain